MDYFHHVMELRIVILLSHFKVMLMEEGRNIIYTRNKQLVINNASIAEKWNKFLLRDLAELTNCNFQ